MATVVSAALACSLAFLDVWGLLRSPLWGLALFARIGRDDVMEHGTRKRVLEAVSARPGMTLQALQAWLGVAWGTMVHHVHLLERHGRIVSVRQGPRRLLYAASTPEARVRAELALLRSATAKGIAHAVRQTPGIQQVEVCRLLGLRTPSASKHLSRLSAAGLVLVEKVGGGSRYRPTSRLHAVLDMHEDLASRSPQAPGALVSVSPAGRAPVLGGGWETSGGSPVAGAAAA